MRKSARTPFIVILLLSISVTASAQDKSGRMFKATSVDSLDTMLRYYLEESTSKHFEDPNVPRFLIQDRSDNFVFGVGGYAAAKLFWDWCGSTSDSFNTFGKDRDIYNSAFAMSFGDTHLSFKLLGKTKRGYVDAYVETAFDGADNTLKLSKVYINLLGFRVGKAQTAFRDDESLDIIDDSGFFSKTSRSVPGITYSYRFRNGIRLHGGWEFPQTLTATSNDSDDALWEVPMSYPDNVASIYYSTGKFHLHGGLIGRPMTYYSFSQRNFKADLGYGFTASGNFTFLNNAAGTHKLYLQGVWSHGMSDCCGSLRGRGLNLVMVKDRLGASAVMPDNYGFMVGYKFVFGLNAVNAYGSMDKVYGLKETGHTELYDRGYAVSANYMRRFLTYGIAGIEAVYGRRCNIAGDMEQNIRASIYLRYDF